MNMRIGESYSQREVFGKTLVELGDEFPELLVLDPDVSPSTQTHLFQKAYPDRFIETGIAEQNAVGIAAGLASMGYTPFVSAFAVFLAQRSGDQIRNSIAHTRVNVKLNGAYGGLPTGRAGATHSAFEDIACMRCLPNMVILEPADPMETMLCTRLALEIKGPVYLRTVRCNVPVIFDETHKVELGKAVRLREGKDITIISTGMMTPKAQEAVKLLVDKGIDAKLLHMHTIKPFDKEAVIEAARTTKAIITVENHSVIGGLGSAVCEVVAENGGCPVKRLGFQDIFLESGDDEVLFGRYGINVKEIAATAEAQFESVK